MKAILDGNEKRKMILKMMDDMNRDHNPTLYHDPSRPSSTPQPFPKDYVPPKVELSWWDSVFSKPGLPNNYGHIADEDKPAQLLKWMKDTDWDEMQEDVKSAIIAKWKKDHPEWVDRQMVYDNLIANKSGTVYRPINNIIASTALVTTPPRLGVEMKMNEDLFYNDIYPRAASIFWWSQIYGVTLTTHPVWYYRIYVLNVPNAVVLGANEGADFVKDHSFGIGTWALMAVGVAVAVAHLI